MTTTQLSPEQLIAQIPAAAIGSYGINNLFPTIEIDCSGRRQHTTREEQQLLRDNGYVEMYSYLVVGWDMWVLTEYRNSSEWGQ